VCRETIAPREATDSIEEAREDCEHRGGLVTSEPCPREGVAASCALPGGVGPIAIFAYEVGETIATLDDLCSAAEGTFERAR
jgi:hypothetical protein